MRPSRPISRSTNNWLDTRLVVVASDDISIVQQYFELFQSSRLRFKRLEPPPGNCPLEFALKRFDDYVTEFDLGTEDEFWVIADLPATCAPMTFRRMNNVIEECSKRGIRTALSCPCFELWLLLHLCDVPIQSDIDHHQVSRMLSYKVPNYNNEVANLLLDFDRMKSAIARAYARGSSSTPLIPPPSHTQVHLVLESLIECGIAKPARSNTII